MCDSLAALKPIQIIGGEQSLFCVTGDGKVSWIYYSKIKLKQNTFVYCSRIGHKGRQGRPTLDFAGRHNFLGSAVQTIVG